MQDGARLSHVLRNSPKNKYEWVVVGITNRRHGLGVHARNVVRDMGSGLWQFIPSLLYF